MFKQLAIAAGLGALAHSAGAANFSFTGNLAGGNDRALFTFGVDAQSQVVIRTLSFAGGVNANGATIAPGGFDPVVSVFNSSGVLLVDDDDGRGVADPLTGLAFDSELMVLADPGDYTTVVTQFPNFPAGSTLAEGFLGGAPDDFFDRTSFFAVDILNVARAQGGHTDTGQNASSNVTASTLLTQTAAIQPGIVGQRVVNQVFQRQLRTRQLAAGRIHDVPLEGGRAAGDGEGLPIGAWVSFQHARIENRFVSTAFDSDVNLLMGGVDWHREDLLLGVGLGYESQSSTTRFNAGAQDTASYTVVPYLGYLFNDWLSGDVSVGYSRVDIDQSRTLGFLTLDSEARGIRSFAAANLNAVRTTGNWLVSGVAGVLYVRERHRPFTEKVAGLPGVTTQNAARAVRLGQVRVGGGVSYLLRGWEPFANLHYVRDYTRTEVSVGPGQAVPSDDDDEFRIGAGIRYLDETHGVSAALEYMTVRGRDDIDSDSVSFTVRVEL